MDPGFSYTSFNLGAAAFWLFIAAVVAISSWEKTRRNAEKHETLRRMMDKTGAIDEARLKDLFAAPPPSPWVPKPPEAGSGYRFLLVAGTILMFTAGGLIAFFLILENTGAVGHDSAMIGLASTTIVALLGAGMFVSARFVRPPPNGYRGEPPAR
jgi:hypothetical protein